MERYRESVQESTGRVCRMKTCVGRRVLGCDVQGARAGMQEWNAQGEYRFGSDPRVTVSELEDADGSVAEAPELAVELHRHVCPFDCSHSSKAFSNFWR